MSTLVQQRVIAKLNAEIGSDVSNLNKSKVLIENYKKHFIDTAAKVNMIHFLLITYILKSF